MDQNTLISRRSFIGGLASAGFSAGFLTAPALHAKSPLKIIKPQRLKKGDLVGLLTPASPVFEPSAILEGKRALEELGFRVKIGARVGEKWGYLAGSDQDRAGDLMEMFLDDEVRAIVALRGGYGSIRILPHLDYTVIRRHPKILLGYSDITSLHLAIHKLSGIVTFHGPVALSTFNEYSTHYLLQTLTQARPVQEIQMPPDAFPLVMKNTSRHRVSGQLVGGNLTLVSATLGTPYEVDTKDKILFLEEVGEEPYSIDRMLTQLRQAGKLQQATAIILDRCRDCGPAEYKPAFNNTLSIEEVIQDRLGDLDVPVLYGLSIGHVADKPVLPLGVKASIDLKNKSFAITEAAVL